MDFITTIDIIIKDLREAREIIDDLKNYPGVPQFQIELAKAKCKSAEEVIALLKTIKTEAELTKPEKRQSPPVVETPVVLETVTLSVTAEEKIPEKTENKPVSETEIQPKKKSENRKEASIIADRFSDRSDTIHASFEKISMDDDLSSVLKAKPVMSLSEAIGINDKFIFVREVFGGSQSNYDEAIIKLNNAESLSDARAIIMSYTGEGVENEVVSELLILVKRKLASDG